MDILADLRADALEKIKSSSDVSAALTAFDAFETRARQAMDRTSPNTSDRHEAYLSERRTVRDALDEKWPLSKK